LSHAAAIDPSRAGLSPLQKLQQKDESHGQNSDQNQHDNCEQYQSGPAGNGNWTGSHIE
jgi:hypothetical protein